MANGVYIPVYIKVHLGRPDEAAEDVTVPFLSYVKNVGSSEIFPTWPESAIRANMYAQISFALNRIFTEHYRSRGYDFDITNSPDVDQSFVYGRQIFGNIDKIGNELFNDYIIRSGFLEPIFARYCDGRTSTCPGLSQWGSVALANQGKTPYEILQNYYGDDIQIVRNAPILDIEESFPGYPIKRGDRGDNVARIQNQLNRISRSYPTVPSVGVADGDFGAKTEASVKAFQKVFNIPQDGIVGKETWYRMLFIYNAVKRLADLQSEGERLREIPREFERTLSVGMTGKDVNIVQFFINTIANYNPAIPSVRITSTFDEPTRKAVIAFQKNVGLPQTGTVDQNTYQRLYKEYQGAVLANNALFRERETRAYPGTPLRIGSTGDDVTTLQLYLLALARRYPEIPQVVAIGYFGDLTEDAVKAFQKKIRLRSRWRCRSLYLEQNNIRIFKNKIALFTFDL